jgi:CBS domain-containing protein
MSDPTLDKLVAADCMQRDVVTIGGNDTLRDALDLMTENHVTGLPVMDGKDHCIGLISATDILNYEHEHAENIGDATTAQHYNPDIQQWETVSLTAFGLEDFGEVRVQDVMARDLISVNRNTPLQQVAKTMLASNVHRVLVLDDELRLYGLVSSLDFVRAVADKG